MTPIDCSDLGNKNEFIAFTLSKHQNTFEESHVFQICVFQLSSEIEIATTSSATESCAISRMDLDPCKPSPIYSKDSPSCTTAAISETKHKLCFDRSSFV